MKAFWKRYARHRGAVIGLVVLTVIVLVALTAPVLFPQGPWTMVGAPRQPPGTRGLPFGSDVLGRNVAAAVAYGARVSMFVGLVATAVALLIGVTLGSLAGYFGGRVEEAIIRFTEFFQVIPNLVLLMVLVALLTPSLTSTIIGIGFVSWPAVARVVRAEFLTLKTREFVQAAHVLGESHLKILVTQILPNSLPPIIVIGSLMVATAILAESGLSFLGLGDPNQMSWGFMIGAGRSELRNAWWISFFPGVAIMLTVLSINMIGEGLNDALNPRLARGGRT